MILVDAECFVTPEHPYEHIAQPHMQEYFAKTNPYHASPTPLKIY